MAERAGQSTAAPPLTWRLGLYGVIWSLHRILGWRVRPGRPNPVPRPDQPLVVVFNHTSNVDAFLVADTVWRRLHQWCQPMVKAELLRTPVFGRLLRAVGAIPVVRSHDAAREAAYDAAVGRLRAGGTIILAPEGTTTHDGTLLPFRHGAARLALDAQVDVLAVTQFGAQRGFSPVVRRPERGVIVTMAMDLITPLADEDASSLTGRIAATMLDRSIELRRLYPQQAPSARWWPPYAVPASPTAIARQNIDRYRQSMADAIAQARQRMADLAEEYEVEDRVVSARRRMADLAEEYEVEERVASVRDRGMAAAEDLVARSRARRESLTEQTRNRMEELTVQARDYALGRGDRNHARDEPDRGTGSGSTSAVEPQTSEPQTSEAEAGADERHRDE